MIVITGAAGFIGSCLVSALNEIGITKIILVDNFLEEKKNKNLKNKKYYKKIPRNIFIEWFKINNKDISLVFHLGARTDTISSNYKVFEKLNLYYSQNLWQTCSINKIPFIYASSAATYGSGDLGFEDKHNNIKNLRPLNAYSKSKNEFDKWILRQDLAPPYWIGLKFFNVYGPNEYHKGPMSSVIFHMFNQIAVNAKVNLFKSHNRNYQHGEQLRDFIYVKDVINVLIFIKNNRINNGIYNLGTGKARSFIELSNIIFDTLNVTPNINFIDTPKEIRDNYQYFTQAKMDKLIMSGYTQGFTSIDSGVKDYICKYLLANKYY